MELIKDVLDEGVLPPSTPSKLQTNELASDNPQLSSTLGSISLLSSDLSVMESPPAKETAIPDPALTDQVIEAVPTFPKAFVK